MPAPVIVDTQPSYLVVYKPPQMHTVPLHRTVPLNSPVPLHRTDRDETLLDWCARLFPEVLSSRGRNPWEGGMLHRLDYETGGLVLLARNQTALDTLLKDQSEGRFVKEYEAAAVKAETRLPGFPAAPSTRSLLRFAHFNLQKSPSGDFLPCKLRSETKFLQEPTYRGFFAASSARRPCTVAHPQVQQAPGEALPGSLPFSAVESAFRAYGPGGKAVRPVVTAVAGAHRRAVLDKGKPYRTEIIHWETQGEYTRFRLRIYRGFRHQIRCHLAWLGYPLLNDTLYGGRICPHSPGLALRAQGISFPDPETGELREYALPVTAFLISEAR